MKVCTLMIIYEKKISNITFDNINYSGSHETKIIMQGYDENSRINDVEMSNSYIKGNKISNDSLILKTHLLVM